jgi:hypothetical protein
MAAKKKKKVRKTKSAKKAKRKSPARKSKTVARKAKKVPAKKKKKTAAKAKKKAPARKPAKKTPAKKTKAKKKQVVGEGDYQASRAFLKDQSNFVEKNRDRIPSLGQKAEKALEGPDGDSLRDAEATAAARSRDLF